MKITGFRKSIVYILFLANFLSFTSCKSCGSGMKKGKSENNKLKKDLSEMQYEVTQNSKTEAPFKNKYYDHYEEGIYVDVVSGEALFSSQHKYKSGTGWPSFYDVLEPKNIVTKSDTSLAMNRVEVRSKNADSHLGHVFEDGPPPTHKRYCINSAALRFVPKERLSKEGYEKYLKHFKSEMPLREKIAYFGGGCFWCMEADFLKIKGIKDVTSGYMGGDEKNPTYEEVSSGKTGHKEIVRIKFNPDIISYEDLLKVFFMNVDITNADGQFCDEGSQYASAIFYTDDAQKKAIKLSLSWLKSNFPNKEPKTLIKKAKDFYKAEDYHQRYFKKNPVRYKFYRFRCGRDKKLKNLYKGKRKEIMNSFMAK